jgi:hypothetical protein
MSILCTYSTNNRNMACHKFDVKSIGQKVVNSAEKAIVKVEIFHRLVF